MSEDKKPDQISIVSNKWIPQYIWSEMPGIDGQKRRAFYLKQKTTHDELSLCEIPWRDGRDSNPQLLP